AGVVNEQKGALRAVGAVGRADDVHVRPGGFARSSTAMRSFGGAPAGSVAGSPGSVVVGIPAGRAAWNPRGGTDAYAAADRQGRPLAGGANADNALARRAGESASVSRLSFSSQPVVDI